MGKLQTKMFLGWCERCGEHTDIRYDRLVCAGCTPGFASAENARFVRKKMIKAFGGRCQCCGENREHFLDLDHIDDNGADERRALRRAGKGTLDIWKRATEEGVGGDYQLLCSNCNQGKRRNNGACPHIFEVGYPMYGAIFPATEKVYEIQQAPQRNKEFMEEVLWKIPYGDPWPRKGEDTK